MSCQRTRSELSQLGIQFIDQRCQARYKDANGTLQVCGCLLSDHIISHESQHLGGASHISPLDATMEGLSISHAPPTNIQHNSHYSQAPPGIHSAGSSPYCIQSLQSVQYREVSPPPADPLLSGFLACTFPTFVVQYASRFLYSDLSRMVQDVSPGAEVHFPQVHFPHAEIYVKFAGGPNIDELRSRLAAVVGDLCKVVDISKKSLPRVGVSKEHLLADERLRALEDATKVLCFCGEETPHDPEIKLVCRKDGSDSSAFVRRYYESLAIEKRVWSTEKGGVFFVHANKEWFHGELSRLKLSVHADMQLVEGLCTLTGKAVDVQRAVSVLDSLVCDRVEVLSSDSMVMDAVLATLSLLQTNNQTHGPPPVPDPNQCVWTGGIGSSTGLVKVFRDQSAFLFVSIPEFRHVLKIWVSRVSRVVRMFVRDSVVVQGPHPPQPLHVKSTFGLHHCEFDSSTNRLLLMGLKDRVLCAQKQHPLLMSQPGAFATYRVSCACVGGDIKWMTRHFLADEDEPASGEKSHVDNICNDINKARFANGVQVSACMAGFDSGLCDDAVLVLFGHASVINDALEMAVKGMNTYVHKDPLVVQKDISLSAPVLACVIRNHQLYNDNKRVFIESSSPPTAPIMHPSPFPPTSFPAPPPLPSTPSPPVPVQTQSPHAPIGKYVFHGKTVFVGAFDYMVAIEKLGCDAMVNSVNPHLRNGAGIARVIENGAGPQYKAACDAAVQSHPGKCLTVGRAYRFDSFALSQRGLRHILNTLIPRNDRNNITAAMKLDFLNAIKSALSLASQNGSVGVAIPGMGTGVYGWSIELATNLAVQAVQEWLLENGSSTSIQTIVMLDFSKDVAEGYNRALSGLGPNMLSPSSPLSDDREQEGVLVRPTLPEFQWFWATNGENLPGARMLEVSGKAYGFMPYSYDHLVQIEAAYRQNQESVMITVPEKNLRYRLYFGNRMMQVNEANGGRRRIIKRPMDPSDPPPLYAEKLAAYENTAGASAGLYQTAPPSAGQPPISLATLAVPRTAVVDYEFSYDSGGLTIVGCSWMVNRAVDAIETVVKEAAVPRALPLEEVGSLPNVSLDDCVRAINDELRISCGLRVIPNDDQQVRSVCLENSGLHPSVVDEFEGKYFINALVDVYCRLSRG